MNESFVIDRSETPRNQVAAAFSRLERTGAQFFGEAHNPLSMTGGFVVAIFIICAATGIMLSLNFIPTPDRATLDLFRITNDSAGSLLRGVHRASADLLLLSLLIHILKIWSRGNFRGSLKTGWVYAILLLPVIGITGWAGYSLGWDQNAAVLLSWGKELVYAVDSWPIAGWFHLGTILGNPVFFSSGGTELILKVFGLHLAGTLGIAILWAFHARNTYTLRLRLPFLNWLGLSIIILIAGAILPIDLENVRPLDLNNVPTRVQVDGIINFPLLFYPLIGAPLLTALIVLTTWIMAYSPFRTKDKYLTASVIESNCTGCRLCAQDCPYDAIYMFDHRDSRKLENGRELAAVIDERCTSCGICVGSCSFDAIEIPDLPAADIEYQLEEILGKMKGEND
ncbi:MAG TPA: 4Fe-4S binding protein [bacterium]|jgi:ferredoxin